MKGELVDLSIGLDGRQRITISTKEDLRGLWDELHGGEVRVEIKKWHDRRSLTANAYAWVLIDKLAEALNLPKTEIYRNTIRNIGGVSSTVFVKTEAAARLAEEWGRNGLGWTVDRLETFSPDWVQLILYAGSSTYDGAQMARLIDSLIGECRQLGIETLPPWQLAAMVNEWGGKANEQG